MRLHPALIDLNVDQFSSQIETLNQQLLAFEKNLQTESELLHKNQPEALSQHSETKAALVQEIQTQLALIESQLNTADPKKPTNLIELTRLHAFSDLSDALQKKVDQTLALTESCSDLNDANGIAIQILNNINQASIHILAGQADTSLNLYGASGETRQSKQGSSLGKA